MDLAVQMELLESEQSIVYEPTKDFKTFERYLDHLNRQINKHLPFLKVQFGVATIHIMVSLKEGGILTEKLKKKWFDKGLSKTTVLVQFSFVGGEAAQGDSELQDMVNIRQFRSVKAFMSSVKSLVNVLENIDSFSREVRKTSLLAKRGEREQQEEHKGGAASALIVEETKGLSRGEEEDLFARQSELNLCSICFDRTIERVLSCYHAFCQPCIDDWRTRSQTCPMCRQDENERGSFELLNPVSVSTRNKLKTDLMK